MLCIEIIYLVISYQEIEVDVKIIDFLKEENLKLKKVSVPIVTIFFNVKFDNYLPHKSVVGS